MHHEVRSVLKGNQMNEQMAPANPAWTMEWNGLPIRVAALEPEPMLVAADVAEALGLRDADKIARLLDDDMKGTHHVGTLGGPQEMITISREGLILATLRAEPRDPERAEKVKAFRRWACRALDQLLAGRAVQSPTGATISQPVQGRTVDSHERLRLARANLADAQAELARARAEMLRGGQTDRAPRAGRRKNDGALLEERIRDLMTRTLTFLATATEPVSIEDLQRVLRCRKEYLTAIRQTLIRDGVVDVVMHGRKRNGIVLRPPPAASNGTH